MFEAVLKLKTTKVSDNAHRELTWLLGEMMVKTGKTQTYNHVGDALILQSLFMPAALIEKIVVAMLQSLSGNREKDLINRPKTRKLKDPNSWSVVC